jgi:hypothetical protein
MFKNLLGWSSTKILKLYKYKVSNNNNNNNNKLYIYIYIWLLKYVHIRNLGNYWVGKKIPSSNTPNKILFDVGGVKL